MPDNPSERSWADALEPQRSPDRSPAPAPADPVASAAGWPSPQAWPSSRSPQGVGNPRVMVVLVLLGLAAVVLVGVLLAVLLGS